MLCLLFPSTLYRTWHASCKKLSWTYVPILNFFRRKHAVIKVNHSGISELDVFVRI